MTKTKKPPVKKKAAAKSPKPKKAKDAKSALGELFPSEAIARAAKDVAAAAKKVAAIPIAPPPPTGPDANTRQRACMAEIDAVLLKHRCRLAPALNPLEPIGNTDGLPCSKAIVSATWGVLPEA